jgi:hypothetical protein
VKPIVLIHGYSSEGKNKSAEDIYGQLPADLRREFGAGNVLDINLSRWISLSDGVALDDVSFAMERALNSPNFKSLREKGFHMVVHSTGALVARNWIRLFSPKPSPIGNLVHLAGANFGSGLAHVGLGSLARWSREIFLGVESGVRVLDELEFGSNKTLDLHLHFLQPGNHMDTDYQVQEFCAIGSQTLKALRLVPVRYVKEDSADNTVRTSACNLNFNYLTVRPTPAALAIGVKDVDEEIENRLAGDRVDHHWYDFSLENLANTRREVPFALLYETAHFGDDLGIVNGNQTRKQVLPLLVQALSAADDEVTHAQVVADWRKVSETTVKRVAKLKNTLTDWNRREQYEGHSQLIFRVRDQFGAEVCEHDITFNSGGPKDRHRLEKMIEDKHRNRHWPGSTTYYLRTQKFEEIKGEQVLVDRLDNAAPMDFEITGCESQSDEIRYLPLRMKVSAANLKKMIEPFRTTVVDVVLLRLPSGRVFELKKSE